MTLANAHALFCGLKAEPSYLANLAVPEKERRALIAVRNLIRTTIKSAAMRLSDSDIYWQEPRFRALLRNQPAIEIKFMMQGSFAYGTLNAPAQKSVQEIDLDDGMYVPVHFLDNGKPALAAKGLFSFVEEALVPLCKEYGWALAEKDSCVRVNLWAGAHIDIPIYSVPQERFSQLRDRIAKSATASIKGAMLAENFRLPSNKIMLAHRDGTWVQSDPRQLHDWVEVRIDRYGAVYRRLARFFKGWRDYTWEKSSLSSICLMCAVDSALAKLDGFPSDDRDDELVMEVAKRLPEIFSEEIPNPVLEHLCVNQWNDDQREAIVAAARALRDEMTAALERTGDAEQVVLKLRKRFGERIPYRPDSVKIGSKIAAIERAPAATVAAPRIIPSTSG